MKQLISIGAVLIVLLLALAACASPDAPAADTSVEDASAAVSESTEPEAEMAESEAESEMAESDEEMEEAMMDEKADEVVSEEVSSEMAEDAEAEAEMVEESGPTAQEVAQMERAAAGTIRDNERAGNRQVDEDESAAEEIRSLASFLPNLGEAPEIINGEPWINSDPLTLEELEGKVVVIEFWTYS